MNNANENTNGSENIYPYSVVKGKLKEIYFDGKILEVDREKCKKYGVNPLKLARQFSEIFSLKNDFSAGENIHEETEKIKNFREQKRNGKNTENDEKKRKKEHADDSGLTVVSKTKNKKIYKEVIEKAQRKHPEYISNPLMKQIISSFFGNISQGTKYAYAMAHMKYLENSRAIEFSHMHKKKKIYKWRRSIIDDENNEINKSLKKFRQDEIKNRQEIIGKRLQ